ncbi:hypothetical protein RCL1_001177 [Eukaryota sp. TZLM3-RCL]
MKEESYLLLFAVEKGVTELKKLGWSLFSTESRTVTKFWQCRVVEKESDLCGVSGLPIDEVLAECQHTVKDYNCLALVTVKQELLSVIESVGISSKLPRMFSKQYALDAMASQTWSSELDDYDGDDPFEELSSRLGLLKGVSYNDLNLQQKLDVYAEFFKLSSSHLQDSEDLYTPFITVPPFVNCHHEDQPRPDFKEISFRDSIKPLEAPAAKLSGQQVALRIDDFVQLTDNLSFSQKISLSQDFATIWDLQSCFPAPSTRSVALVAVAQSQWSLTDTNSYYRGSYPTFNSITTSAYLNFVAAIQPHLVTSLQETTPVPPLKKPRIEEVSDYDPSSYFVNLYGFPAAISEDQIRQWCQPFPPSQVFIFPVKRHCAVYLTYPDQFSAESIVQRNNSMFSGTPLDIRHSSERHLRKSQNKTDNPLDQGTPIQPGKKKEWLPTKPKQTRPLNVPPHDPRLRDPSIPAAIPASVGSTRSDPRFASSHPQFEFFLLRGIPYRRYERDVIEWLGSHGVLVHPSSIVIPMTADGKHSGSAYVAAEKRFAEKLYSLHRQTMDQRFIEVMNSNQADFDRNLAQSRPAPPMPYGAPYHPPGYGHAPPQFHQHPSYPPPPQHFQQGPPPHHSYSQHPLPPPQHHMPPSGHPHHLPPTGHPSYGYQQPPPQGFYQTPPLQGPLSGNPRHPLPPQIPQKFTQERVIPQRNSFNGSS